MLSRRSVRIKVMQTIYSVDQGAVNDYYAGRKVLLKNLEQSLNLFYFQLLTLISVADFSKKFIEIKKSKLIADKELEKPYDKILDNRFLQQLRKDKSFLEYIKNNNLKKFIDQGVSRDLFQKIAREDFYEEYMLLEDSPEADKDVMLSIFKIMMHNERYQSHLEEYFTYFDEDVKAVQYKLMQWLEKLDKVQDQDTLFENLVDSSDTEFALELYESYQDHQTELENLIKPQLKNWDIQRIARLDIILIKLALCELLYFEHIPVKVSINEYIDISKLYSTPKSHEFVNGITDKLKRKLQKEGKIVKTGRGLLS